MRISDWSSDVCSSDLVDGAEGELAALGTLARVRHGVEQPGDLGAGEVGVEQQAGALPHQVFGTLGTQLLAESGGAAVLPDDRLVDGRTGLAVPDHRRLALVGDADGGDLLGARTSVCQGALHDRPVFAPDVLRGSEDRREGKEGGIT